MWLYKYSKREISKIMKKVISKLTTSESMFMSYVIILSLTIIVSLAFFGEMHKIIYQNETKNYEITLNNFADTVDNNTNNVMAYSYQLMNFLSDTSNGELMSEENILSNIRKLSAYNELIEDSLIFVNSGKDNTRVISRSGVGDIDTFYYKYHLNSDLSLEDYRKLVNSVSSPGFISLPINDPQNAVIAFALPGDNPNYTIITYIYASRFFPYNNSHDSFMYIRNNDHPFYITDNAKEDVKSIIDSTDFDSHQSLLKLKSKSGNYIVNINHSPSTSWDYFYCNNTSNLDILLRRNVIFFAAALIICFIVGLFLSYLFTNINYSSLKSILLTLPNGSYNSKEKNKYKVIQDSISKIVEKNAYFEKTNNRYANNLKQLALTRLLCDYINPSVRIDTLLNDSGISFPYSYYYICCISCEDISEDNIPLPLDLIFFSVDNVLNEMLEKYNENSDNPIIYEYTLIHQTCAIIFNTDRETNTDIEHCTADTLTFLQTSLQLNFKHSISNANKDLYSIYHDFNTCYEEVTSKKSTSNGYEYNDNVQKDIMNSILAGDSDEALNIVKSLYSSPQLSQYESVKCLSYDLIYSISESFSDINAINIISTNTLKDIVLANSKSKLIEIVNAYILNLSSYYASNDTVNDASTSLAKSITAYVEAHYNDPLLNVNMISDHFKKTPSHITRVFKSVYGITLSNYISEYRINEAVNLLNNTNKKIKDISDSLGYANSNVFIRTFKKIKGVTPAQFRLTNNQNPES